MTVQQGAGQRRVRVMVVEDDALGLELVRDILEEDGYEVLTATDGANALAAIAESRPDLVLMDVQLPQISGLEVTRRLKADPETRSIPVIALTAHAMRGDDTSIVAEGCDGYISKPFKLAAFREAIAGYTSGGPRPVDE